MAFRIPRLTSLPFPAAHRAGSGRAGSGRAGSSRAESGWFAVTVDRPESEVAAAVADLSAGASRPTADRPAVVSVHGLATAGFRGLEIKVNMAPQDHGTEVRTRAVNPGHQFGQAGSDQLREWTRAFKQQLEAGELLQVLPVPHGQRTPGPGAPMLGILRRLRGKGWL